MADLAVRLLNVSYSSGGKQILSDLDICFRPGLFNVVLGPNGAGKSTLMRIAAGRFAPSSGKVLYGDLSALSLDATWLARRRAFLSQQIELSFPLLVEEVVLMGRYPHYRGAPSSRDKEIVSKALDLVDMGGRRRQPYPTLSGGERQKTHLARVLAQIWNDDDESEERVLFLDEPTTSLDIHYQIHLLDMARKFLARRCTIVASLHDLNMAFDYGDHFFLLEFGRLLYEAEGARSIPKELIERVYRVKAEMIGQSADQSAYWRFRL
jgi:iron complex transport system ATP-binding protein